MLNNKKQISVSDLILNASLITLCILFIIPFLIVVSISLTSEQDIIKYGYSIIPKSLDVTAYKFIFNNPASVADAYCVTIFSTVVGTALSVFLMSMIAYPLSRSSLKGRGVLSFYLFFTMLFSGGLAPTYILITQYYKLGDSLWVYILPALINPWNVFMIRTFFQGIPGAIIESALIDGASEYRIFLTMILPVSKPILATVALMVALTRWNDWMVSMLYINNQRLISLQYLLQRIMLDIQLLQQEGAQMASAGISLSDIPSESVRMAMAVIVAGPMLVVFPFFQKYFVKGLTVGSVKG